MAARRQRSDGRGAEYEQADEPAAEQRSQGDGPQRDHESGPAEQGKTGHRRQRPVPSA